METKLTDGSPSFTPRVVDAGYAIGCRRNVVLAVTREPPSLVAVDRFAEEIERLLRASSGRVGVVIAPRAARPALPRPVLAAILDHWARIEPHIFASTVLFRAAGFVGAIQRSLLTAILTVRRPGVPFKPTADPIEAAEWLCQFDTSARDQRALGAAIDAFVSEYEHPAPKVARDDGPEARGGRRGSGG